MALTKCGRSRLCGNCSRRPAPAHVLSLPTGRSSLHAEDVAPGLVPVGHEGRAFLLGL